MSTTQPPRTKNQHYAPQLHLRHFVGQAPANMVWSYDSERGTARPSTVENTGAQTNFYSVRRDDGTYNDDLDIWLRGVESAAAAPYRQLLEGSLPVDQAKMDFAVFVAAFYARSPALIRAHAVGYAQALQVELDMHFSTRESFDAFMDRFEADTGEKVDRERFYQFWSDKDRFWIEISQKRGLSIMAVADRICELLFERHWYLAYAAEDYFITCDSPVVRFVEPSLVHPFYGDGGFNNPASEVTIPLSPKVMLLITGQQLPQTSYLLPAERVWAMNGARAVSAERFLFAPVNDPRVSTLAAKHKDDKVRFGIGNPEELAEVRVTR